MPNWLTALRQAIVGATYPNRRREQRQTLKLSIEVRTREGTIYRGVSRDLSKLGMGAVISAPLNLGDEIHIKYEHPGRPGEPARSVVRRATVQQRYGYRYGFEFDTPLDV